MISDLMVYLSTYLRLHLKLHFYILVCYTTQSHLPNNDSFLNGRRIYGGGVHPPFTIFFDFRLRSLRYEKDFCQCYQNYLRHLWLKFFIFQMSGRWFPWHPKGGGVHPPHKSRGVFYTHIGHGN